VKRMANPYIRFLDYAWCRRCGMWIPHRQLRVDAGGGLCCPRCGRRVRTYPRHYSRRRVLRSLGYDSKQLFTRAVESAGKERVKTGGESGEEIEDS